MQGSCFVLVSPHVYLYDHSSRYGTFFNKKKMFVVFLFLHKKHMMWLFIRSAGWWGGVKVSCILFHQGVQLILVYRWVRPAILVAGKGRGGNVFISSVSSLSFLFLFLLCSSLSSVLLSFLSFFSLSLGDDTK